jgi:hypothetical protein
MPAGRAEAQAVSRRPLSGEARIQSQTSPRGGIRGGQSQHLITTLKTTWESRWTISALDNDVK